MSNKLNSYLNNLKSCIPVKKSKLALEYLENVFQCINEDLTESEAEYVIDTMINAPNGVLAFLNKSFNDNKTFKDCNTFVFQMFQKLIPRYGKIIKKSAEILCGTCLKYVRSSFMTARERELAAQLLQDLIIKNMDNENVDIPDLIRSILSIFDQKKLPSRFQQSLFELLGIMTKEHPEKLDHQMPYQIRDILMKEAESQLLKGEYPNFSLLAGAIVGLDDFLVHFAPSTTEEPVLCQRIYVIVKKLSDWGQLSEKAAFRNAMHLLSRHSHLMMDQIFHDYKYWHVILTTKWMSSVYDDRKTAIYTLHAVHQEVSNAIEAHENMENEDDIEVLNYFMKYFKATLQKSTAKSYELRIAIRGFGVMAGPCKKLLPPEYLNDLLSLVMQRTEYTYMQEDKATNTELLEHLPDFVQALSQIMNHVTDLSGIQLNSLQNIIIALIRDFHFLSKAHHDLVVQSLMKTFNNLYNLGGSILDDLLERVVLKGVIWTSSHKLKFDVVQDWDRSEDWKDNVTFENYLPLWNGLLAKTDACNYDRSILINKIYKHLIKSLFTIIEKLDLSTKKRIFMDDQGNDQEIFFCDPNVDLNPVRPKDFFIFLNVVEFYTRMLRYQMALTENFEEWIPMFCELMISKAIHYPLVSGFVKLLELGVVIADRIDYFNESFLYERNVTFGFVTYFLEFMIAKSQKVTGELQISCLRFVLSSPISLLNHFIGVTSGLVDVFITTFDIGKGILWLASAGLTCLQKIIDKNSIEFQEFREKFLEKVLPSLDSYLQTQDTVGVVKIDSKVAKFQRKRGVKKSSTNIYVNSNETELYRFQKRILLFLGSLEPNLCVKLLSDKDDADQNEKDRYSLVKWDLKECVKLQLLCPNGIKPTILLDSTISRICGLALKSSDRRTKISACELLHAIILYVIGTGNHNLRKKLWLELCKHILLLSVDTDVAVQQMFEPLLIQIIHFLTQQSQIREPAANILVDSLMDSISHRSNSSVRDLSARCIREFITWTIKQTTVHHDSPANIQIIIVKLKTYCQDSDPNRRIGAALAFNNIYRLLREEESQIEKRWFDIFFSFNMNFAISEEFDSAAANLEQITASIDHLVRVLIVRKDIFNADNKERVVPKGFQGPQLQNLVYWVFEKCSAKQSNYRHKCMENFMKLATAVDKIPNARDFLTKFIPNAKVLEIFEHDGNDYGIHNWTNDLSFLANQNISIISAIYLWLEYFLSSLDAFVWAFKSNLFENPVEILEDSQIFPVIEYFLKNIASSSMLDLQLLLNQDVFNTSQDSTDLRMSIEKILKFNTIRCTIIVRIIDFLNILLSEYLADKIPNQFWSEDKLANFIIDLIFKPQEMGFDFKSCQETITKLPKKVEELLKNIDRSLKDEAFKNNLYKIVSKEVSKNYKILSAKVEESLYSDTIKLDDLNLAKGILMVSDRMENLRKYFEIDGDLIDKTSKNVLFDLFRGIKTKRFDNFYQIQPPPTVKRFGNIMMSVCFNILQTEALHELIVMILDDQKLQMGNTTTRNCTIQHGEHFVDVYKESIFNYFNNYPEKTVEIIVIMMNQMNFVTIIKFLSNYMEHNYTKKKSDIEMLKKVTELILKLWPKIFEKAKEIKSELVSVDLFLIELMSHVAMASPIPLNQFGRKAEHFHGWICGILADESIKLDIKSKAMFLLPTLVGSDDFTDKNLTESITKMQNKHIPLRSSEFPPSSLDRASLVTAINSFLDAFVVSKSPVLLQSLVHITAADEKHILEHNIRKSLMDYMKTQNVNQQIYNMKMIFDFFSDTNFDQSIRITILKRFMVTMIRALKQEAFINFYKENIKKIEKLFTSDFGAFNGQGRDTEQALVNRIGGFQLVELYVAILPRDQLLQENCPVARILTGKESKGNVLISEFIKKAYYARSEVFVSKDQVAMELYRKYQCSAFKALCALVSNVKDDIKFYDTFLFRETPEKKEFVWQKLIDCTNDQIYDNLSQECDDFPKIKDKIVSIRNLRSKLSDKTKKFKYIQMSSVFESSLSQDVTKLDLSSSVVRTTQEALDFDVLQLIKKEQEAATIELEKSSINDHEIMAVLCAVIQHMFDNKITPISDNPNTPPPNWVKYIAASLRSHQSHKNIRLFLAKLIDNCREYLRHYAKTLIPAIMQVIVDECICKKLNSFVTDLTALILEWSDAYVPASIDEIYLASSLVKFVMSNCYNDKKEIFKMNLEIVKNLVELWKDEISLPIQLLYNSISRSNDPNSTENLCGLQLNAIVMANGKVPWTDVVQIDFIRAIFNCLDNEKTAIYQPASELLGMCLNVLYPNGSEHLEEDANPCFNELTEKLIKIRKSNEKKAMDILYGVHKNFPPIIDKFLETVIFNIPVAVGAHKKIYLEMLLSRVEACREHVHRELMALDLRRMLKTNDFQLISLHIINKSLPLMTAEQISDLIEDISAISESSKSNCRDVMYEIFIFIKENSLAVTDEQKRKVTQILLKGLNDPELNIQNNIYGFWTHESQLNGQIHERFLETLQKLYDPQLEKEFLGYATQMLLENAIKNPESKYQIFRYQSQTDTKYHEYQIDTSWRQRHTSSTAPLFVESQQRHLVEGEGSQYTRILKVTQDANENFFEPTQDPVKMSQSQQTFSLPMANSLLFNVNPPILDRRSRKATGDNTGLGQESQVKKTFENLRKRFLKDKEKSQKRDALQAIERHSYNRHKYVDMRKQKESQVTLYRRYRIGEMPDLMINYLALLMPLQALCRRDPILARQIFVSIFISILTEMDENQRSDETKVYVQRINQAVERIFSETKNCEPNFFGCLIEICLSRPKLFDLSPENVVAIANVTNMMTIGTLYLENKLTYQDFDQNSSKMSTSSVDAETLHWLKLSELYHSLSEYDIVSGVFSDKLTDTNPALGVAISLESAGEFSAAQKKYRDVITSTHRKIYEQNYCYQSYYNCFVQMGNWNHLITHIGTQVDNYEELWTDDWNQENLLPHLMRGELMLILQDSSKGEFIKLIESWVRNNEKCEYLKQNFGEEMTMLQIVCKEYTIAKVYSEQVLKQFLSEWCYLNILSDKLRATKLLSMRKVSELHNYSNILGEKFDEVELENLYRNWSNSSPGVSDSLVLWDCIITYREFICRQFEELFNSQASVQPESVKNLGESVNRTEMKLLAAAFAQNNLDLANIILERTSHFKTTGQTCEALEWDLYKCTYSRMKAEKRKIDNKRLSLITKNFTTLNEILADEIVSQNQDLKIRVLNEACYYSQSVVQIVQELNLTDEMKAQIMTLASSNDSQIVADRFQNHALWCLKEAVASTQMVDLSISERDLTINADSNFKIAQFCYEGLEKEPVGETFDTEKELIKSLLRSIQYNSKEGRQLFPCLLQLPNLKNNRLKDIFKQESASIPEWAFLRWISQILSHLDFKTESFLEDIVLKLAKSYPIALKYPFNMSYKQAITENPSYESDFVGKLKKFLDNALFDKMTQNFACVLLPETMICNVIQNIIVQINNKVFESNDDWKKTIQRKIHETFEENANFQGTAFKSIQKYKEKFKNLLDLDIGKDYAKIVDVLHTIFANTKKSPKQDKVKLTTLSQWLAGYQFCGEEEYMEVPGQYENIDFKPHIENHVKIFKFGLSLKVYESIRRPVKIQIYGSDGKIYEFLVKYGEDLRQDQRIQQLLLLISNQLKFDKNCRNNALTIKTYTVLPMDQHVGIISFIPQTIPVRDVYFQAMSKYCPNNEEIMRTMHEDYKKFIELPTIRDGGNVNSKADVYGKAASFYDVTKVGLKFLELSNLIPHDIIKKALFDMAVSPESFYSVRNNFAKSLATMNIAHWILGIGDRHLTNVLLNLDNGFLIGIDFGMAFGTATRDLPIPEIMPFRLTPHFVNVMEPMGTSGLISKVMIHTLRCLQNSNKLLKSCMEVFVKEPTLDWLESAAYKNNQEDKKIKIDWDPKTRVNFAVRKLNGANPKTLVSEELHLGRVSENKNYLKGYLKHLQRNKIDLPDSNLSVEQQVACLIDMATDRSILGITYEGWNPWV